MSKMMAQNIFLYIIVEIPNSEFVSAKTGLDFWRQSVACFFPRVKIYAPEAKAKASSPSSAWGMRMYLLLALLFELSIYLFRRGGETVSVVDPVVPRWEPPSWKDWESVCEGCGVLVISCLSFPACLALVDDEVANMRSSGGGAEWKWRQAAWAADGSSFWYIYMPRYNLGGKSLDEVSVEQYLLILYFLASLYGRGISSVVTCPATRILVFYKLSKWITIRINIFLVKSKKIYDKAYHRVANILFWPAFFRLWK